MITTIIDIWIIVLSIYKPKGDIGEWFRRNNESWQNRWYRLNGVRPTLKTPKTFSNKNRPLSISSILKKQSARKTKKGKH